MTIDHPELPDTLKQIVAEAVQTIWQSANEAATAELATLRVEARHIASEAEARQAHTTKRGAHSATQARLEAGRTEQEAGRRQLDALRTEFSRELERAREAVTLALDRTEASERRSLRELDSDISPGLVAMVTGSARFFPASRECVDEVKASWSGQTSAYFTRDQSGVLSFSEPLSPID